MNKVAYYKEGIEKLALNARAKRVKALLAEARKTGAHAVDREKAQRRVVSFIHDSGMKLNSPESIKILERGLSTNKKMGFMPTMGYKNITGRINNTTAMPTDLERRKRYIKSGKKAKDLAEGAPGRAKELEDFKALENSAVAGRKEQARKSRNMKLGIGAGAGAAVGAGVYMGTRRSDKKKKKVADYKEGIEKLARS